MVARGEVWWGETPDEKGRPFLDVSRDAANRVMQRVLVAPVTSRIRGIPSELPLGEAEGLLQKAKSLLEKADTPANRSLRVHLMLSTAAFFGLSGHADDARNMVSEVLNHDKDNDYAKELLAALGH